MLSQSILLARDYCESGEHDCTSHPSALDPPPTGTFLRRVQHGPCLEFIVDQAVVDHQFVSRGRWPLAVVENDESTHAEVCNFACSAAAAQPRVVVIAGYLVGSDRVFFGFLPRHSIDISWRVIDLICAF